MKRFINVVDTVEHSYLGWPGESSVITTLTTRMINTMSGSARTLPTGPPIHNSIRSVSVLTIRLLTQLIPGLGLILKFKCIVTSVELK